MHVVTRFDCQAGGDQAAVDQVGRCWIFFSLRLMMRTCPSRSAAAELALARLNSDQMPSAGLRFRRVSGQPVNPQPCLILRGAGRQLRGQVDVEVTQHRTSGTDRPR